MAALLVHLESRVRQIRTIERQVVEGDHLVVEAVVEHKELPRLRPIEGTSVMTSG
ncbi:hypothetical protein [Microbacterium sp. Bi121]|uniref:hypothetical protein n=1 Tax=Microbacterium sp. Bi121 TaxID=2822348 RepID=UPI001E2890F2|nr:hypothetical protein [Microbacterium sp. Bi121]